MEKKLRGFFSFGLVIISWNKNPSAINVMGGLPYLIFHNFKDIYSGCAYINVFM